MDEPSPVMRASDADRERVAERLRTALGEGRLTLEEFDVRVADVYAARTYGDLSAVTADLPSSVEVFERPTGGAVVPRSHGLPATSHGAGGHALAWGSYLSANLICLIVWASIAVGGGGTQGYWFLWVAGPWGAVLIGREVQQRRR
jgi:Domain of unknown function (DUF1707)